MAKVLKDIYVSWDWSGDVFDLKGFNIAITPSNADPKIDVTIQVKTGKDKTDILDKGTLQYEHILRDVTLDNTKNYTAWVQALYTNSDSDWVNTANITISDDGTSTIATTNADSNPISAGEGKVILNSGGIIINNGKLNIKTNTSSDGIIVDNTGIRGSYQGNTTFEITNQGEILDKNGYSVINANGKFNNKVIASGMVLDDYVWHDINFCSEPFVLGEDEYLVAIVTPMHTQKCHDLNLNRYYPIQSILSYGIFYYMQGGDTPQGSWGYLDTAGTYEALGVQIRHYLTPYDDPDDYVYAFPAYYEIKLCRK